MSTIEIGRHFIFEHLPTMADTAAAIGNSGVEAVSTPATIAFVEQTCHLNIKAAYEPGWGSVGTSVEVKHVSPAWPGTPMICETTVESVTGRAIRFNVRVTQQTRLIMSGWHDRALVDLTRFAGPANSPARRHPIQFFFDFHSPWCYLALDRFVEIAEKHNRPIVWKPIHLANLIDRIDGRRPLDGPPAFVRWFKQDMQDWARRRNVVIQYHSNFPLRPSRALRCSLYAAEHGKAREFVRTTMRAYWSENRDISDLSVLGDIGESVGLNQNELASAGTSSHYKELIERNTEEAIAQDVFGAPSFFADGRLFWGNDRLEMLDDFLRTTETPDC